MFWNVIIFFFQNIYIFEPYETLGFEVSKKKRHFFFEKGPPQHIHAPDKPCYYKNIYIAPDYMYNEQVF